MNHIKKYLRLLEKIIIELVIFFVVLIFVPQILQKLNYRVLNLIRDLDIAREINLILNVGLSITGICFCIATFLYGLELFDIYDFKKFKLPRLSKVFLGKLSPFSALMLVSSIIFLFLFLAKVDVSPLLKN